LVLRHVKTSGSDSLDSFLVRSVLLNENGKSGLPSFGLW